MAYIQKNNPFKSPLKQSTTFVTDKAPSGAGDIKKEMEWKYGHGEFASKEKRRKPGESKFNYDVRMRKKARKVKQREPGILEREITDTSDLTREQRLALGEKLHPETNPNDKRDQSKPQNFGIIPGMTFGEAFAQAGKGGARAGQDPFFWTNPKTGKEKSYLYEFKKEEEEEIVTPPPPSPPPVEKVEPESIEARIESLRKKKEDPNLSIMEKGGIISEIKKLQAEQRRKL